MITALIALASAGVPMQIAHQGRLLDADGSPVEGRHTVSASIYASVASPSPLWSDSWEILLTDGYFEVVLGGDTSNPIDSDAFASGEAYLGMRVDSVDAEFRSPLVAVPYAILADTTATVTGGSVTASSLAIQGVPVIDASPNLFGSHIVAPVVP